MLSERIYKIMRHPIDLCSWIGSIPLVWDPHKKIFLRSARCHHLIRRHLCLLSPYLAFLLFQSIRFKVEGNLEVFNLVYAATCLFFLLYQILIWLVFLEDETYYMTNFIFTYLPYINKRYYPDHDPNTSRLTMLIDLGVFFILLGAIQIFFLFCLALLIFPEAPMFPGNLLPPTFPILLRLLICYFYPCYVMAIYQLNNFLIITTIYGYGVFFVPFVILELRLDRRTYRTCPELREPENLILAYRSCQVFQQQAVNQIGLFIVPTQTLITQLVIVASYTVIKHGKQMELVSVLMLLGWANSTSCFWCVVLLMGGYLHFYGVKVLQSWKYHEWGSKKDKKLMSRFRKSCRPIVINYRKFYVIKRLTVLKFVRGLSRGILRALLTL